MEVLTKSLITCPTCGFQKEEEIAEISGNVALNLLTNYFNELAGTEIDFPIKVQPLEKVNA